MSAAAAEISAAACNPAAAGDDGVAVGAAPAAVATPDSKPFEITYPPLSSAAQSSGRVTLVGFGSLLSQRSCSATFPTLYNFRVGVIRGWRRIFAHVAPIFIERGIATVETREMSSLSVEPAPDPSHTLLVSVFEIPITDLPAFYSRELEFRWLYTPVYSPASVSSFSDDKSTLQVDSQSIDGRALICAAYTDEEYRRDRLNNSREAYHQAFGRWGIERIWRNDLLPCPVYLRHVVLAAAGMDQAFRLLHYSEKECLVWKKETESKTENSILSELSTPGATSASATPASSAASMIVTPTLVSLPSGEVLNSFLDHTYLGDRVTSIRQYLNSKRGAEIMTTLPPPEFSTRYNG